MAAIKHLEVWDKHPLASGAQRKVITRNATKVRELRAVGSERRFTFSLPLTTRKYGDWLPGRWAVVMFRDGTGRVGRIVEVADASDGSGESGFTCGGLGAALVKCPLISRTDVTGYISHRFDGVTRTAAQHLSEFILPAAAAGGYDFVVAGTISSTALVDLSYDGDNPWTALQKLAEATLCEIDDEIVGNEWRIHLVPQVGAGTKGGTLRVGDNASLRRIRSQLEQQTEITGLGADGITIADAIWKITNVAGNVLTLADPAGGDGAILRDDQLTGAYAEASDRATRTEITACSRSAQTITVTSATGFAQGDLIRIRKDSAGTHLTSLADPVQVAAHGVLSGEPLRREDIPQTVNLLPNSTQSGWTGADSDPADLWAVVGTPTITRTTATGFYKTGGQSAKVETNADGEGYATPLVSLGLALSRPHVSGFLDLRIVSGKFRVEMVATNGSQTWIVPDGIDPARKAVIDSTAAGEFQPIGVAGIDLHALGATAVRFRVVQDGAGTGEIYVDAGQITESAAQLPFVDGAGPTKLWQAVNAQLALAAPTRVRYEVDAIDFFRLDGTTHPHREFKLGAQHTVHDPVLGIIDGVRVLELEEDLDAEGLTRLVLSNRAEDLASLFDADPASRLAGNVRNAPTLSGVRTVTDGQTQSLARLNSATAGFTTADIGKTVWIVGGGTGGTIHKTTINGLNSATQVTIVTTAPVLTTGLTLIIGSAAEVATIGASIGGTRAGAALLDENGTLASGVKDSGGRTAVRFFAKTSSGDADTFDGVPNGATYIKVIPFLTIKADQSSITSTTVVVAITVSDPSGGAAPTISHNGGGSVTGSGPYTIARPAAGAGPLLVTFTASKTGRVSQTVTVTAPEQASGGTVPPSIDAFYATGGQNNGADTLPLAWTVSNAPGGATYDIAWDHNGSWRTAGGVATGVGSSPINFNCDTNGDADLVTKGTSGYETITYALQLRMKSGSTIVATKDIQVTVFAKQAPP